MNPLLLFTLLCPDTAYFGTPFPVQIHQSEPAPLGKALPTAWEARSALAGIVGQGTLKPGADSLTAWIDGPGAYLEDGVGVSVAIGTYDPVLGQIKAVPGAECLTVMKTRPSIGIKRLARLGVAWMVRGFRLDGRVFK